MSRPPEYALVESPKQQLKTAALWSYFDFWSFALTSYSLTDCDGQLRWTVQEEGRTASQAPTSKCDGFVGENVTDEMLSNGSEVSSTSASIQVSQRAACCPH